MFPYSTREWHGWLDEWYFDWLVGVWIELQEMEIDGMADAINLEDEGSFALKIDNK